MKNYHLLSMLTLGQTPSIPVVSMVPTIIRGMGALFGFPEQSDVPPIATMILSSKPVSDKVDDGIMKEALLDFYISSGKRKLDQIIIFRDRVSESQFNQVLIKLLRLASSLTRSGTLKIVVIVVRKTIIPFQQGSPDNVLHGTFIDNKAGFSADDLQDWGQFMKIRDASETSSSHGGMYAPGVISIPQLSRTAAGAIPFSWVYESRFFLQALMERGRRKPSTAAPVELPPV
ncbi:hypothetical protein GOBAR_AA02074 [Gossypium barbadense]|uniref:Piwi domain-containing protein n=1 Tax=Gossypium barbadense TaxID=3634 RepID=A0A2P5YSD5_GOSBA|nr:hypothetical protein GOBAR_AA02074 [Gossypium barbadense]